MATLDDLYAALKAADAAGNKDDATKLANAIYELKLRDPNKASPYTDTGALPGGTAGQQAGGTAKHILGEVARGSVDILGGGAQLLSRGANAMGLVPQSNPDGLVAGPSDVEAQNAQARQNIDAFSPPTSGFSPVRAAASAALTMPLSPMGYMQAPTILGRAAGATVPGGIAGAMQEVPDGKDFWKTKAQQVGVGMATAGIAQPIAEGVVRTVVGGLNKLADFAGAKVRDLSGANSIDQIVNMTREALKKSGIDYDSLGEQARQGLLDDVQKALGSYSGINPAAVARQAAFRQEGFDPLRHWISKDPTEFTQIENLAHTPQGGPLKQRMNDLDSFVMDRLNSMRGDKPDVLNVGDQVKANLKSYLDQQQGKTNVLYRTFGEIAPDAKGDPQRFANDVFGGLEGQMAGAALPGSLREIVNKISSGDIPLTPSVLYQLQKMAKPGADGTTNFALGHLSRAIDREMGAISQTAGGDASQAGDVLQMARAQHANTRQTVEGSGLLTKVEANAPAEDFSNFMDSDIRDVANNWSRLSDDSKNAVRSQVMDDVRRKAFGGASDESGKAGAQATLNNYLSDPETAAKLKIVLGDKGFQDLKRLGLMMESAKLQPSGSAVNNSKTGGAVVGNMFNLAAAMGRNNIPGQSIAQNIMRGDAVKSTLLPSASALGQQSLAINPLVEEILARRAGNASALLGGANGYPALLSAFAP